MVFHLELEVHKQESMSGALHNSKMLALLCGSHFIHPDCKILHGSTLLSHLSVELNVVKLRLDSFKIFISKCFK